MKPIISLKNVSKAYPVYRKPGDLFREVLTGRQMHDEFWALNDISLELRQGQRLGIIGQNGSGKSTLLKVITGHLDATSGSVSVDGKVSAMLSLNTVLNPDETGLDNIRFNLILNGCDASLLEEVTEEIIEFTELGSFIEAPVKTYSSGMNAKLAFAINTAIQPEILIIDEVLSVGDAYFVGKATNRMIELCNKGKALIFVSHSTSAIKMLCDTVLWLDNGNVKMFGEADYVLEKYEEDYRKHEDVQTRAGNRLRAERLAEAVEVHDLKKRDFCNFRLTAMNDTGRLKGTYFIRKIEHSTPGLPLQSLDLKTIGSASDDASSVWLNVLESEWGRLHTIEGVQMRALTSQTGRKKGGHILFKAPGGNKDGGTEINLLAEYKAPVGADDLQLEMLDVTAGEWTVVTETETTTSKEWRTLRATLQLVAVDDEVVDNAIVRAEELSQPDVEIVRASVTSGGEAVASIVEYQPFELSVNILANRVTPLVDVGIRIMRSDGVYAFWQSSGQSGNNISNLSGSAEVKFTFDPNVLGVGDYQVIVYCADGWTEENDFQYAQVYDRKVNIVSFSVHPKNPKFSHGIVNRLCSVKTIRDGH